jgi:hypothetical protein
LFIDLAAEQAVTPFPTGIRRIAMEIKTFSSPSVMADLHNAVGQFVVYRNILSELQPERELYLAIPESAWQVLIQGGIGISVLRKDVQRILTFDADREEIIRWEP